MKNSASQAKYLISAMVVVLISLVAWLNPSWSRLTLAARASNANPASQASLKRSRPELKLNGHSNPTVYLGAAKLTRALEQNLAQPLALAAGDFDEDGLPDLVSGYRSAGDGLLTLPRGNIAAIYP